MIDLIPQIVFYAFAAVLVAAACMVVAAKNPVHSVLYLILCFFNASALFVMMGAEFVAFVVMIVYVGAVMVLFLFVVMMLDVNFAALRQGARAYLGVGLTVGAVVFAQLTFVVTAWKLDPRVIPALAADSATVENTRALGRVLYTDFAYPFQVSGLILLAAMVGAIVLTLRDRKAARHQKASDQIDRRREDVVTLHKVSSREGVL